MEQFLKIWSIVIISLWMFVTLLVMIYDNNKSTRLTSGVVALLFVPVLYYIIKF